MAGFPTALTVAGSDSGGGAGIQADLKTFFAFGVYGTSVITAVTAQNTLGVRGFITLDPGFVRAQLEAVLGDIGTRAVKTGMLANAGVIHVVADVLHRFNITNLVVDPVMVAKSGDLLLEPTAVDALKNELLPLARVITPNLPEAGTLTGLDLQNEDSLEKAGRYLQSLGPEVVVIKGGHSGGPRSSDLVFAGKEVWLLSRERIPSRNTHGTGCTFSAAIAAGLALGIEVRETLAVAKDYITEAIRSSVPLGGGHGPVNHFVKPKRPQ